MFDNDLTKPVPLEVKRAFEALSSGDYANFALLSVNYAGEPTWAIVAVTRSRRRTGPGQPPEDYRIAPIFLWLTEAMKDRLQDPDGRPLEGGGGG